MIKFTDDPPKSTSQKSLLNMVIFLGLEPRMGWRKTGNTVRPVFSGPWKLLYNGLRCSTNFGKFLAPFLTAWESLEFLTQIVGWEFHVI
jgi:hypothetical protein